MHQKLPSRHNQLTDKALLHLMIRRGLHERGATLERDDDDGVASLAFQDTVEDLVQARYHVAQGFRERDERCGFLFTVFVMFALL